MPSTINATPTSSGLVQSADASGVLALQTGGTTAVTIDGSQNVGIGTASPETKLHVTQTNDALPALQLRHGDGDFILMEEGGGTDLFKFTRVAGSNDLQINNVTANNIRIATNNTERMRIASDGNVRFAMENFANQPSSTNFGVSINNTGTGSRFYGQGTGTETQIEFGNRNGARGSIQTNASNTLYNTTSDYRLKENIVPMTGALNLIQALNPVTYDWKVGGSGQGFIAHELAEVVSDCVTGEKDAVDDEGNPKYQMIDTSFLIGTLTAAIQEQQALITQLQADVAALKVQP